VGAVEANRGEVSIRRCVATPSRIVLMFDGQPDDAAAWNPESYGIADANDLDRRYDVTAAEYDHTARVAVLSNPVPDIEVGAWLRIEVAQPPNVTLTHFAPVESELPLLRDALVQAPAQQAEQSAKADSNTDGERELSAPVEPSAEAATQTSGSSDASMRRRWPDVTPALLVVVTGLLALLILGVVAMLSASTGDMSTISTAAFGVIGSVIGAFFGVHAGLGDRKRVDAERQVEATKGQMLAAMLPDEQREAALDMLKDYSPSSRR
jgi:hypothetical protein